MDRVKDKVCIVTGGAMGIGKACAMTLAHEGARVILTDIADTEGEATCDEIKAASGQVEYHHQDVASEAGWTELLAKVKADYEALDVLVNNAGIAIGALSITLMPLADFQKQNAVNLDGVFLGMKHCIPLMAESGGGSIVNMSSVAGLKGAGVLAAYSMTKGGVRLLSKSVALECAAAGNNIRVNSVHPGIINTVIWDKMELPVDPGSNVSIQDAAAASVPGGKLGEPQDIANGVLHLASDDSSYMTGMEFVIDHGFTA